MSDKYTGFLYAAHKDALVIETLVKDNAEVHSEAIAWHSQQVAEKMLKDVFMSKGVYPPKIHDVDKLLNAAIENKWLTATKEEMQAALNLTIYAVMARYESTPEISKGEALQAVIDCNEVSAMLRRNGLGYIDIDVNADYLHNQVQEVPRDDLNQN